MPEPMEWDVRLKLTSGAEWFDRVFAEHRDTAIVRVTKEVEAHGLHVAETIFAKPREYQV